MLVEAEQVERLDVILADRLLISTEHAVGFAKDVEVFGSSRLYLAGYGRAEDLTRRTMLSRPGLARV